MKSKSRFSWGAGIADVYYAAFIIGAVEAIIVALSSRPLPLATLMILPIIVIAVVVYYRVLATKITWRSPGEIMLGRVCIDGTKIWANPYTKSRTSLFTLFFITFVIVGNSWDYVTDETYYTIYTLPEVSIRILINGCLLWGMPLLGAGDAKGAYLVVTSYVLLALRTWIWMSPALIVPISNTQASITALFLAGIWAFIARSYLRAKS